MAEGKKAWFVLRAISGKEAKVKEVLDAAIRNTDLGNQVFQVLIPTEKVLVVHNGKKVVKERNLYSGYVFVECLLVPVRKADQTSEVSYKLSGEVIHELRNTTNVIDFLGGRSKGKGMMPEPEPLRNSEAMRMLGLADEKAELAEDGVNDYVVGETVKVNFGPFSGFIGEIEEVDRERKKLKVMVKIFGRKTPLELENSQVERE